MLRSLFMTLIALLAAACVQVGSAPSGPPAAPSTSLAAPSPAGTPSAPSASPPPTIVPGTTEPTRTRRPRPQRTDRPTRPRPPIQPSAQPSAEPPTGPPTEPPFADLVIEDLTAPESVQSGRGISIGFTIRNLGSAPSGAFAYSYDVGGGGGSTTVDSLLPGQFFVAYEDLGDADYANEVVTVWVVVDSRDEVAESDESNNEGSRQVEVICADDPLCPPA